MARPKSSERILALEIYIKTKGTIKTADLAEELKVKPAQLRKWKSLDKWDEELKKKRKGGQPGNQNAKGAGAPKGNKNAETHGGYSTINIEDLPEEERVYLDKLAHNTQASLKAELQILLAKEKDIRYRLEKLQAEDEDKVYFSRESEMQTLPSPEELEGLEPEEVNERLCNLMPRMKTINRDSKFEREQKLLVAFDRIHGRIIKVLDSIRGYEIDQAKLELEKQKYELTKERAKGAFEFEVDELDELT